MVPNDISALSGQLSFTIAVGHCKEQSFTRRFDPIRHGTLRYVLVTLQSAHFHPHLRPFNSTFDRLICRSYDTKYVIFRWRNR